jgi:hypothetical protein
LQHHSKVAAPRRARRHASAICQRHAVTCTGVLPFRGRLVTGVVRPAAVASGLDDLRLLGGTGLAGALIVVPADHVPPSARCSRATSACSHHAAEPYEQLSISIELRWPPRIAHCVAALRGDNISLTGTPVKRYLSRLFARDASEFSTSCASETRQQNGDSALFCDWRDGARRHGPSC